MAGRPPRQKAKNDARQQLWMLWLQHKHCCSLLWFTKCSELVCSLAPCCAQWCFLSQYTGYITQQFICFHYLKKFGSKHPKKRFILFWKQNHWLFGIVPLPMQALRYMWLEYSVAVLAEMSLRSTRNVIPSINRLKTYIGSRFKQKQKK